MMISDTAISITGTIITIISMIVTLIQATKAKTQANLAKGYKEQIQLSTRKTHLSECISTLKNIQNGVNRLPKNTEKEGLEGVVERGERGLDIEALILNLRTAFDKALAFVSSGLDSEIRKSICIAQTKLYKYENSSNKETTTSELVESMRNSLQDAISDANTIIYELEKENES